MSAPRKSFKTPKGTELPLLSLKGKEYLQVAHRLVWFREEHPQGTIRTQMIEKNGAGKDEFCVFKAEVMIMTDKGPFLVATAHKCESRGGFPDFMEKAETGSVGRALALMGYGTQFAADELDEGSRLADAPTPTPVKETVVVSATIDTTTANSQTPADTATTAPRRASFRKNVTANAGNDI